MCCAGRMDRGIECLIDMLALIDEFDDLSQRVGIC
jgi:hypothetical protein